ncbi:MAG: alpha/beta hydrolase [Lachnospiraceae bacterium]|nr:alpha/beta hydrolase [Lachnospiraceae bacterium]
MKKHKKLWITLSIIVVVLIGMIGGAAAYANDYYHAMDEVQAYLDEDNEVSVSVLADGNMVFKPEGEIQAGFIFYPGGKVEYTAYAPLLGELAKEGILSVLVEMPFNLAVLDQNAADGIQKQFEEITNWYIGGHSLGGAMAATYVSKHTEEYDGLILLAAYSTADISQSGLQVLTIYGSEDKVLNYEKLAKNESNLPDDARTVVIGGGCHSYFGYYGKQKGDGTPSISREDQIDMTVDAILSLQQRAQ